MVLVCLTWQMRCLPLKINYPYEKLIILRVKKSYSIFNKISRRNSYMILKFYGSFVQILLEIKFLLKFSFIPNFVQENIIFMGKIIFLLEFVLGKYLTWRMPYIKNKGAYKLFKQWSIVWRTMYFYFSIHEAYSRVQKWHHGTGIIIRYSVKNCMPLNDFFFYLTFDKDDINTYRKKLLWICDLNNGFSF